MAYVDPYNVQNPPERSCVQQSVVPPFFTGSPKTSKYKRQRGIKIVHPCPQENHGENISPLRPYPHRISLSNQSIIQ